MTGADMRCPRCGGGAVNVSPGLDLDNFLLPCASQGWVMGKCAEGHYFCLHTERNKKGTSHSYLPKVFP